VVERDELAQAIITIAIKESAMKSCNIKYWMQFGAVTAITAAITATLLNIGAAFAADVSADSLKFGPNVVKAPG